jgi:hypothetical protein
MHEKLDGAMHQTSPRAARHSVEDIDEASQVPAGASAIVPSVMTKVRVGACG